jgi:hypothetical protein
MTIALIAATAMLVLLLGSFAGLIVRCSANYSCGDARTTGMICIRGRVRRATPCGRAEGYSPGPRREVTSSSTQSSSV